MGLFPKRLIYFSKYKTIVRSSTWSFGHSDPDPSSVKRLMYNDFAQSPNLAVVSFSAEQLDLTVCE
jgi:hypothetical protein